MKSSVQFCSGSNATCNGEIIGEWVTIGSCNEGNQYCQTDGITFAICSDECEHGCGAGACCTGSAGGSCGEMFGGEIVPPGSVPRDGGCCPVIMAFRVIVDVSTAFKKAR